MSSNQLELIPSMLFDRAVDTFSEPAAFNVPTSEFILPSITHYSAYVTKKRAIISGHDDYDNSYKSAKKCRKVTPHVFFDGPLRILQFDVPRAKAEISFFASCSTFTAIKNRISENGWNFGYDVSYCILEGNLMLPRRQVVVPPEFCGDLQEVLGMIKQICIEQEDGQEDELEEEDEQAGEQEDEEYGGPRCA